MEERSDFFARTIGNDELPLGMPTPKTLERFLVLIGSGFITEEKLKKFVGENDQIGKFGYEGLTRVNYDFNIEKAFEIFIDSWKGVEAIVKNFNDPDEKLLQVPQQSGLKDVIFWCRDFFSQTGFQAFLKEVEKDELRPATLIEMLAFLHSKRTLQELACIDSVDGKMRLIRILKSDFRKCEIINEEATYPANWKFVIEHEIDAEDHYLNGKLLCVFEK